MVWKLFFFLVLTAVELAACISVPSVDGRPCHVSINGVVIQSGPLISKLEQLSKEYGGLHPLWVETRVLFQHHSDGRGQSLGKLVFAESTISAEEGVSEFVRYVGMDWREAYHDGPPDPQLLVLEMDRATVESWRICFQKIQKRRGDSGIIPQERQGKVMEQ